MHSKNKTSETPETTPNKKQNKFDWFFIQLEKINIATFLFIVGMLTLVSMLLPQFTLNGKSVILARDAFTSNYRGSFFILFYYFIPVIVGLISYIKSKESKIWDAFAFTLTFTSAIILFSSASILASVNDAKFTLNAGPIIGGILAIVMVLALMRENFARNAFSIKEISEAALLVAAALVFDQLVPGIRVSAGAGSINLAMLPLFIIAFRFSFTKSWLAIGVVFGLISNLMDGWGFAAYPFDYFLAYGLISFVSLIKEFAFPRKGEKVKWYHLALFVTAILIGTVGRLIGSTISSLLLYGYKLGPALSYNILYVLPSGASVLVIMLLLYKPLIYINERFKH